MVYTFSSTRQLRHINGLLYFQIITSTAKFIKGFSFPFRGKEEIIGREIRDFMENNKALENELVEETGVTEPELMKYLKESVHLKEDKRKNLFRWYLEKKLSRMESGSIHCLFFLQLLQYSTKFSCKSQLLQQIK